ADDGTGSSYQLNDVILDDLTGRHLDRQGRRTDESGRQARKGPARARQGNESDAEHRPGGKAAALDAHEGGLPGRDPRGTNRLDGWSRAWRWAGGCARAQHQV